VREGEERKGREGKEEVSGGRGFPTQSSFPKIGLPNNLYQEGSPSRIFGMSSLMSFTPIGNVVTSTGVF
jgi:hypothetical protein